MSVQDGRGGSAAPGAGAATGSAAGSATGAATGRDNRPASASTDRTLTVLETLVEAGEPLTLTLLAQTAGVPLATCASIVQTLEQRGYASRRIVGRSHFWQPTLRLYALASALIRGLDPARAAQPHLRRLSDAVGLPAHLGVLDGASVVYVAKAATPGFVQFDTYLGKVSPFNLTALGRVIAAYLPPEAVEPLLDRLVAGRGPKATRPGVAALWEELRVTRERGYALEDEEEQDDIGCVAAPVFDAGEDVTYAVGVTGFARELLGDRLEESIARVREAAAAISSELGAPAHA